MPCLLFNSNKSQIELLQVGASAPKAHMRGLQGFARLHCSQTAEEKAAQEPVASLLLECLNRTQGLVQSSQQGDITLACWMDGVLDRQHRQCSCQTARASSSLTLYKEAACSRDMDCDTSALHLLSSLSRSCWLGSTVPTSI